MTFLKKFSCSEKLYSNTSNTNIYITKTFKQNFLLNFFTIVVYFLIRFHVNSSEWFDLNANDETVVFNLVVSEFHCFPRNDLQNFNIAGS